ncbi:MAG: deoxyribodipyrimidine photo-lyase [Microbacter sp.]
MNGIDPRRITVHKASSQPINGIVVYRMSRDQRVEDNWALLFAQQLADESDALLIVVFNLLTHYPNANTRSFDFMMKGLHEVDQKLAAYHIPFILLCHEKPEEGFANFIHENGVKAVVSDFDPLRHKQTWIQFINNIPHIAHYEVDAHNIVPCRFVSNKVEFAAYTLRTKIHRWLDEFLTEFPSLHEQNHKANSMLKSCSWDEATKKLSMIECVSPVEWLSPGCQAAKKMLQTFMMEKLSSYDERRNHPEWDGQSNLSPYLHFGQIAAQRIALEIIKQPRSTSREAFLEELIVRRELADNFCFYNPHYDQTEGFPDWAKTDMAVHQKDPRTYLYSTEKLEQAMTHDALWNAAQMELKKRGKMHGYMRMYWAKKLLEWSDSPETALQVAIYLNDKYALDGRDPNGYTGIAWSIGGVHDRAWFSRPIFGKIRYMSFNGCRSKFDVDAYIRQQMT